MRHGSCHLRMVSIDLTGVDHTEPGAIATAFNVRSQLRLLECGRYRSRFCHKRAMTVVGLHPMVDER
jgi:hypothetical protein